MSKRRKSPAQFPDAKYLSFVRTILELCLKYLLAWKLKEDEVEKLGVLSEKAETDYKKNLDKATKSAQSAKDKRQSFKDLKEYVRWFTASLRVNLNVPDEALEKMGLPPRQATHHEDHPRPKQPPMVSVTRAGFEVTLHFVQQEHDRLTESIMEEFVHGAVIEFRFDGETAYQKEIVTKKKYTFFFTEADEGKRVHVRVAWVNSKLEAGPFCREFSFVVA